MKIIKDVYGLRPIPYIPVKIKAGLAEDVETDLILIPPLMIQPLVENALKHGLLPKQSTDNSISVKVFERLDKLYVEIEDNGVGLTYASKNKSNLHESFGLSNLQIGQNI